MEDNIIFKKAKFGGFDPDDVMDYIKKITDGFHKYKAETAKTIDELKNRAVESEQAYAQLEEKYNALLAEKEKSDPVPAEKKSAEKEIPAQEQKFAVLESEPEYVKNEDIRKLLIELRDNVSQLVRPSCETTAVVEEKTSEVDDSQMSIDELIKKYSAPDED